uniref:Esterase n=1 Tax=Oryza rufipogon TaxID=4529 RepID=A0A0E0PTU4_ORYRU
MRRITWLATAAAAAAAMCWLVAAASAAGQCRFPAVFNFGDSNSDTGGFWAAFPAQQAPFGMTYFCRPAGRASDGRLVVDFIGKQPSTSSSFLLLPLLAAPWICSSE